MSCNRQGAALRRICIPFASILICLMHQNFLRSEPDTMDPAHENVFQDDAPLIEHPADENHSSTAPTKSMNSQPADPEDALLDILGADSSPRSTATPTGSTDAPTEKTTFGWAMAKIFGVLGLLMAVLVGALYLMKRFMPGVREFSGNSVIQVVSRARLSPTLHIYLLRIGSRALVLGVNGNDVRTLSEISSPQEIDQLVMQGAEGRRNSITSDFRDMFHRTLRPEDAAANEFQREEAQMREMQNELSAIRSRIADWTEEKAV